MSEPLYPKIYSKSWNGKHRFAERDACNEFEGMTLVGTWQHVDVWRFQHKQRLRVANGFHSIQSHRYRLRHGAFETDAKTYTLDELRLRAANTLPPGRQDKFLAIVAMIVLREMDL